MRQKRRGFNKGPGSPGLPTSCPAPRHAGTLPARPRAPERGRRSAPGFGSGSQPLALRPQGPRPDPRPPPQRLLLGAQVREALSLARLGWAPARRLRAGPSLARNHEWQSPAGRGSGGGGGGGGLAGQKQHFGGPGGRALRGRHHHHGPRASTPVRAAAVHRAGPAAPSLSTVVAFRDWPAPRDAWPLSAPIGPASPEGVGPGRPAWRPPSGAGGAVVGGDRRDPGLGALERLGTARLLRKGPEPGGVSSSDGFYSLG